MEVEYTTSHSWALASNRQQTLSPELQQRHDCADPTIYPHCGHPWSSTNLHSNSITLLYYKTKQRHRNQADAEMLLEMSGVLAGYVLAG